MTSRLWLGLFVTAVAMGIAARGQAQGTETDSAKAQWKVRPDAWTTRDSLTAKLSHKGSDSAVAAQRLTEGDFHPGDRVLLSVQGEPTLTDTFVVRRDQNTNNPVLLLPNIEQPVQLHGVLRSELEPRLDSVIGHYIKNAVVRAQALLLVVVSGAVRNPGPLTVPADEQLSSVVAQAGGMLGNANPNDITVRRSGVALYDKQATQKALVNRLTIDELGLQAADEVYVGERQPSHLLTILSIAGTIVGVAAGIVVIAKH